MKEVAESAVTITPVLKVIDLQRAVEGATTTLPPTHEEIERLLAVAPSYGLEIKVPGHWEGGGGG